jgi:hypothetical protein
MQYYKAVEFDNLEIIQKKVFDLFPKDDFEKNKLFYIDDNLNSFLSIPELKDNLIRLGLLDHVLGFGFYITTKSNPIHTDNTLYDFSLNLPILGCDNTFVKFFKSTHPPIKQVADSGVTYYSYDENNCQVMDSLELTSPHIIKVNVPHAVKNETGKQRITLLIRLKKTVGEIF